MKKIMKIEGLIEMIETFDFDKRTGVDLPNETRTEAARVSYVVLNEPPDSILTQMDSSYSGDNKQWRKEWAEDNSSKALDGQRALTLLEIACYADIMCHRVEYPLRVATLDYVKENLGTSGVTDALRWIITSYKSGLPLESPGDETGAFKGMLVDSMKIRLTEYAKELLRSSETKENRK